ncbi:MAG: hypothetical protein CMN61_06610 [Sphingobium sp.]|nr:hypothetical protein [Sphingobium sp.]MBA38114.1 hypothetical protein [Sphingobium sp.]MBS48194.1 hypothetical protein [Sphingobium sp.]HCW62420.1 hypothetical protein [Sphingobium sp.]
MACAHVQPAVKAHAPVCKQVLNIRLLALASRGHRRDEEAIGSRIAPKQGGVIMTLILIDSNDTQVL